MKLIYLFFLLSFLYGSAFAQSGKGYVHLKNGSIIKGKYSFSNEDQKIHIKSDKNLWIFDQADVSEINFRHSGYCSDSVFLHQKMFYRIEFGVLAGSSENSQSAPFSASGTVNYRIDPHFSIGLGTGVDFLKESHLPIFANIEYTLGERQTQPFLFLKAGYLVPLEKSNDLYFSMPDYIYYSSSIWPGSYYQYTLDVQGGVMANMGLGFQHYFSNDFGMSFAMGYQFSRLNYQGENDYQLDLDYHRFSIRLGFLFNGF